MAEHAQFCTTHAHGRSGLSPLLPPKKRSSPLCHAQGGSAAGWRRRKLLPGSNGLSQTNRVTLESAVSIEQMLEVAPKPGRDPLGDARFDPALRVHQRDGAARPDARAGSQTAPRSRRRRRSTSTTTSRPASGTIGRDSTGCLRALRKGRRARRLEARPAGSEPRPPGQHGAGPVGPAAGVCGCSPAKGRRSTPRPRAAGSCSASSRRWPSSSKS